MLSQKADNNLLKIYQDAAQNAQCFHDTDDKLESFEKVVRYCAGLPECHEDTSIKKNQVLFWTYHQMGDLMLAQDEQTESRLKALNYYQNALIYARTNEDTLEILGKIRSVYQAFHDLQNVFDLSEKMIRFIDDAFKVEAFLQMADGAQNTEQEAYFLEQALKYINEEKISFLKQCRKTLSICERLLQIYEKAGKRAEALRIQKLQGQTKNMIH